MTDSEKHRTSVIFDKATWARVQEAKAERGMDVAELVRRGLDAPEKHLVDAFGKMVDLISEKYALVRPDELQRIIREAVQAGIEMSRGAGPGGGMPVTGNGGLGAVLGPPVGHPAAGGDSVSGSPRRA